MDNVRRHNPRFRAFTLMELVITIVVVGLLASIAFVGYDRVVTNAAESTTETSLRHIDNAVDVTHKMRTALDGGIRNDDDFAAAAYDSDGNPDIHTSVGSWELRTPAEGEENFDPSTVYYALSPTGITGMVKTVEGSSKSGGGSWHLSFLKSSPVETVTWSAHCEISPADLIPEAGMNPNFEAWPADGCHYEGSFQAGDNPFPVTSIEGDTLTPGEGFVTVALPTSFEGIADEVVVTIQGYDSDSETASPVAEPISKKILAPVAGDDPSLVTFTTAEEVVPGRWYTATLDFITAGKVDISHSVDSSKAVQPWTKPGVVAPELTLDTNRAESYPDSDFDPSATASLSSIPLATELESGYREVTEAVLHYREVGTETWATRNIDLSTRTAVVAFGPEDQGKKFEFVASFTNSGLSSSADLIDIEGLPTVELGYMPPTTPVIDSSLTTQLEPEVRWTAPLVDGADEIMYRTDENGAEVWSDWTTIAEDLDIVVVTDQYVDSVIEAALCTDFGCLSTSAVTEVLGVEEAAVPLAPPAPEETAQENPDVTYEFSTPENHEYRIQHQIAGGDWSGWSLLSPYVVAGVGQYTEVCARLSARMENDYGFGPWSAASDSRCHTTYGVVDGTPTSPVFDREIEKANPDVYFKVTFGTDEQYQIRHSVAGGNFGSWLTVTSGGDYLAAGVGQYTEVCAQARTKVKNAYGWSKEWSSPSSAKCHTTKGVPLKVGTYQCTETIDETPDVTCDWPGVSGATYYQYQYDQDPGSWTSWVSTGTTSEKTVFSVRKSQTFEFRARACNKYGCGEYRQDNEVIKDVPAQVYPYQCTETIDATPDVTCDWPDVSFPSSSGSNYYEYRYDQDPGSWTSWVKTGASYKKVTSVRKSQTFQFQARACNGYGCGSAREDTEYIGNVPTYDGTVTSYLNCSAEKYGSNSKVTCPSEAQRWNANGDDVDAAQYRLNSGSWRSSRTFNNVANYTSYTPRVRAHNGYGWSSEASGNAVTTGGLPTAAQGCFSTKWPSAERFSASTIAVYVDTSINYSNSSKPCKATSFKMDPSGTTYATQTKSNPTNGTWEKQFTTDGGATGSVVWYACNAWGCTQHNSRSYIAGPVDTYFSGGNNWESGSNKCRTSNFAWSDPIDKAYIAYWTSAPGWAAWGTWYGHGDHKPFTNTAFKIWNEGGGTKGHFFLCVGHTWSSGWVLTKGMNNGVGGFDVYDDDFYRTS